MLPFLSKGPGSSGSDDLNMNILTLNAGSATLKYKLFALPAEDVLAEGSLDHPGGEGIIQAAEQATAQCRPLGLDAVGHRRSASGRWSGHREAFRCTG